MKKKKENEWEVKLISPPQKGKINLTIYSLLAFGG
jgi:uncharacterized protein YggU (UPF0235/DUF167 family)